MCMYTYTCHGMHMEIKEYLMGTHYLLWVMEIVRRHAATTFTHWAGKHEDLSSSPREKKQGMIICFTSIMESDESLGLPSQSV